MEQVGGQHALGSRAVVVRALTERLPLNELDLPEGIYRPDLLPATAADVALTESEGENREHERERKAHLAVAYMPLLYDEGFPTTPDGRPFWSRLDFEPLEAYEVFQAYLAQGLNGARQIFLLVEGLGDPTQPDDRTFTSGELQEFFSLYYWAFRSRAYDLFRVAESRRTRFERALAVEDNHFLVAERLMGICGVYWNWISNGDDENTPEQLIKSLKPKTVIELTKMAAQLQRISADLPATGPSAQAGRVSSPILSTKDTIRSLTRADDDGDDMTAEDVVRKILQLNQQFNITINAGGDQSPQSPQLPEPTPMKVIQDFADGAGGKA